MSPRIFVPPEFIDTDARCSCCGTDDWTATWSGHARLYVCRSCAIDVLPALIADAIWRPILTFADVEASVVAILRTFWRGIALCGLRRLP